MTTTARSDHDLMSRPPRPGRPDLQPMVALLAEMGDPHLCHPAIHIAGTNGKTSTSRMIDELLRAAGLRVGRFTSPHLTELRERIVIDGDFVHRGAFEAAVERVLKAETATNTRPLSFFEAITAVGFECFAGAQIDVVVLEVGMGGRWDPTNVIAPEVAVITPISLDHTAELGPDHATIAAQKAGIIKSGCIAVVAPQPPTAHTVLLAHANAVNAEVEPVDTDAMIVTRVTTPHGQDLELLTRHRAEPIEARLRLIGRHQAENACVALTAVETLLRRGGQSITPTQIAAGLAAVDSPGRLERLRDEPTVIVDASHNEDGAQVTSSAVRETFPHAHIIAVLAVMADKDALGILGAIGTVATTLVLTQNSSPRAMSAASLVSTAISAGIDRDRIAVDPNLESAVRGAIQAAARQSETIVLVTGSVVTAGEAAYLLR
ncbi:bifunctional folylpolyglutamate synthase/dihydrofolate synthase [Gordonia terrae]